MRRGLIIHVVTVVLLGLSTHLLAQPAMPKVPVLESSTYLLVKIDLNRLDPNVISKWLDEALTRNDLQPAELEQMRQVVQPAITALTHFRQGMIDAKAPVVYFVLSDFPARGPTLFAPVGPGGNAENVRSLLNSGSANGPKGADPVTARPTQMVSAVMPDGVFLGIAEVYARIKEPHGGAPHLLFGLTTAPDAPIQAVAAPSEILNLNLEATMPQIPPPVALPITTITRGVSSVVGTLKVPPGPGARIVIQAADAAAAGQVKLIADRLLPMLNMPQIQRNFPGMDFQPIIAALTPQVQGDQVILAVEDPAFTKIASGFFSRSLLRARETAMRVRSAANIRVMLQGMLLYANDNRGTYPDTLNDLIQKQRMTPQVFVNARGGPASPDYIYIKPTIPVRPDRIIVYENPDDVTEIVNVGYGDGHVDAVPKERFQQMLDAQK